MPIDNRTPLVETMPMTAPTKPGPKRHWIIDPEEVKTLAHIAWPGQHNAGLAQCLGINANAASRHFKDKSAGDVIAISEDNLQKLIDAANSAMKAHRKMIWDIEARKARFKREG